MCHGHLDPLVSAARRPTAEAELEKLASVMPSGEGLRRVAAIDLGTNSTHLLIASVDPKLRTFQVLLAEKSTTRLGERDPETGDLSPEAMERARLALRHCRELASSHEVRRLFASPPAPCGKPLMGWRFCRRWSATLA